MATHSSVFAWRIPGTAEPGGLPSVGSHSSHAVLFPAKHREPALISPGLCLLVPKLAKVPALFLSPRHRWHLHPAESPGFFPGGDGNYQPRPAWMSSAPSEGISGLANESLRAGTVGTAGTAGIEAQVGQSGLPGPASLSLIPVPHPGSSMVGAAASSFNRRGNQAQNSCITCRGHAANWRNRILTPGQAHTISIRLLHLTVQV